MFKPDPAHFRNAKQLGVEIKPSVVKNKKLDVLVDDKKVASIGDTRFQDYRSYIKSDGLAFANKRKKLYKIRHQKTRGKVGTPSFFADRILWQ